MQHQTNQKPDIRIFDFSFIEPENNKQDHPIPSNVNGSSNNTEQLPTPTQNQHAYYRSRIFTAQSGDNTLLVAAAPILCLFGRLQNCKQFPNAIDLHNHLAHELSAFETQSERQGITQETIRLARFALCATLDEILIRASWQNEELFWEHHSLLSRFEGEEDGSEKFFLIIERLFENPKRHLDLLELFYVCLSSGFEGKYRNSPELKIELEQLLDKLYFSISEQRGELQSLLSPTPASLIAATTTTKTSYFTSVLAFFVASCMTLAFAVGLDYMLTVRTQPVISMLEMIAQNIHPLA